MNRHEKLIADEVEKRKNLLEAGLISEEEFVEYLCDVSSEKVRRSKRKRLLRLLIILLAVAAVIGTASVSYFVSQHGCKRYERYLYMPFQLPYPGSCEIDTGDITVKLKYMAKYDIEGLVVITRRYDPTDVTNKLSPLDVGLSWGFLARNNEKVVWSHAEDRVIGCYIEDGSWVGKKGGNAAVVSSFSNNHLIPANDEVRETMDRVKVGDTLRIKGYLADISWEDESQKNRWTSSLFRFDTGDGACEIIYVTDIVIK